MNRLPGLAGCAVLASATLALAGCGNGGSEFVGTWDCGIGTDLSIAHSSGNSYTVGAVGGLAAAFGNNKDLATYKDGALIDGSTRFTINDKTGELVFGDAACKKIKG